MCHGGYIPTVEFDEIHVKIHSYMSFYRTHFPGKVTPKLHMLENHVLPWLRRWGVGMAMHGEQGGESVHAQFNTLTATHSGIRNDLTRLMSVMKEHHTRCSPQIQDHVIPIKKRK